VQTYIHIHSQITKMGWPGHKWSCKIPKKNRTAVDIARSMAIKTCTSAVHLPTL